MSFLSSRSTSHDAFASAIEFWNCGSRALPVCESCQRIGRRHRFAPLDSRACSVVAPGPGEPDRRPHRLPGRLLPPDGDRPRRRRRGSAPATDGRVRRALATSSPASSTSRPTDRPTRGASSRAWGRTVAAVLRVLAEPRRGAASAFDARRRVDGAGRLGAVVERGVRGRVRARVRATSRAWRSAAASSRSPRRRPSTLATGVPCGVMDQMASVFGRAGHALLLDCRSLDDRRRSRCPPTVAVVVVHSGRAAAARGQRVRASGAPRAKPPPRGSASRRCATRRSTQVADDPIARHVVSENARVLAFVDALARRRPRALRRS